MRGWVSKSHSWLRWPWCPALCGIAQHFYLLSRILTWCPIFWFALGLSAFYYLSTFYIISLNLTLPLCLLAVLSFLYWFSKGRCILSFNTRRSVCYRMAGNLSVSKKLASCVKICNSRMAHYGRLQIRYCILHNEETCHSVQLAMTTVQFSGWPTEKYQALVQIFQFLADFGIYWQYRWYIE